MVAYLFWFVVIWFLAGLLTFPLKFLSGKIMHTDLSYSEDIVLDSKGARIKIDRGIWRVVLLLTLSGLVGLWLSLGALAAALYEYLNGTNFPGKQKIDFFKGDSSWFNLYGPLVLVYYIPASLAKFLKLTA